MADKLTVQTFKTRVRTVKAFFWRKGMKTSDFPYWMLTAPGGNVFPFDHWMVLNEVGQFEVMTNEEFNRRYYRN